MCSNQNTVCFGQTCVAVATEVNIFVELGNNNHKVETTPFLP